MKKVVIRKRSETPKPRQQSYQSRTSPARIIKAIPGTGGVTKLIAARLGVSYSGAYAALKRDDPDIQLALEIERERIADIAEITIREMMGQRMDFGTAARTARWLLERKHSDRGYKDKTEVTLQGGNRPIQIEGKNLVAIAQLDLPLEVRKALLDAIEKKEEEEDKEEE